MEWSIIFNRIEGIKNVVSRELDPKQGIQKKL